MLRRVYGLLLLFVPVVIQAECSNIHCGFEYMGVNLGNKYTKERFIEESAVSNLANKYCVKEFMFSFRELNWYLYQFEKEAIAKNYAGVSNAVEQVTSLLYGDKANGNNTWDIKQDTCPVSLKILWLEKIEYSMARMILSDARDAAMQYLEILLPDSMLYECEKTRPARSVMTFKKMLYIAAELNKYISSNRWCPVSLDEISIPEQMRKCAYGRDIEYEHYRGIWMLRCRCESWEGGLEFDEYVPLIYTSRKHLDLCLSSTFNVKRAVLYSGEPFYAHDDRLSCMVIHDKTCTGVHKVKYKKPDAGNFRIKPSLERRNIEE